MGSPVSGVTTGRIVAILLLVIVCCTCHSNCEDERRMFARLKRKASENLRENCTKVRCDDVSREPAVYSHEDLFEAMKHRFPKVEWTSGKNVKVINTRANESDAIKPGMNAFIQALHLAYAHHHTMTISPDDLWIQIGIGFAIHVGLNKNSPRIKNLFAKMANAQKISSTGTYLILERYRSVPSSNVADMPFHRIDDRELLRNERNYREKIVFPDLRQGLLALLLQGVADPNMSQQLSIWKEFERNEVRRWKRLQRYVTRANLIMKEIRRLRLRRFLARRRRYWSSFNGRNPSQIVPLSTDESSWIRQFINMPDLEAFIVDLENDRQYDLEQLKKLRLYQSLQGILRMPTIQIDGLGNFKKGSNDNDWTQAFGLFGKEITKNIGTKVEELVTHEFSTTTHNEMAAMQVNLMHVVKSFFENKMQIDCGIPYFKILGTIDDYVEMKRKVQKFRKFDLDDWVDNLEILIDEFIKAKKENFNEEFFKQFYKYEAPCKTVVVSGHVLKLFPYVYKRPGNKRDVHRRQLIKNKHLLDLDLKKGVNQSGIDTGSFPAGLSSVQFTWRNMWKSHEMSFVAGHLGVRVDEDGDIRPVIGSLVTERSFAEKPDVSVIAAPTRRKRPGYRRRG